LLFGQKEANEAYPSLTKARHEWCYHKSQQDAIDIVFEFEIILFIQKNNIQIK